MDLLDTIQLSPLKSIKHPKGDLFHALKKSDASFNAFGEAYFSTINQGDIKAWKNHSEMTCNLIVPIGNVKFVCYDETVNTFFEATIGTSNYQRLTIPPKIWFGFSGIENYNLILNIADIEHNESECLRRDLPLISYDW